MKHGELFGTARAAKRPADLDCGLPMWSAGLFKAFGAIFFLPSVLAGILIAAMILQSSRILFLLAVLGYFAGTFVRNLIFPAFDHSLFDGNSFNYVLIAMAVGGVFVIPSLQSTLLGLLAAAVAPMLVEALTVLGAPYGIPPFTLPFCLVTLGLLYVLRRSTIRSWRTISERLRRKCAKSRW